MSKKIIIILLTSVSILAITSIIFLYYGDYKQAYNQTLVEMILADYAQKNLTSNMQSGLKFTDRNILSRKNNLVYTQWMPSKDLTATLSLEISSKTNSTNRIFFTAISKQAKVKGSPQEIYTDVASTLAQAYWIYIPDSQQWTCNRTQYNAICTAYAQTYFGKNEYSLKFTFSKDFNYQSLISSSCFIPKKNPQYLSKTPCLSQL